MVTLTRRHRHRAVTAQAAELTPARTYETTGPDGTRAVWHESPAVTAACRRLQSQHRSTVARVVALHIAAFTGGFTAGVLLALTIGAQ